MALLAQREQSVAELRRKLLQHARRLAAADVANDAADLADEVDAESQVDEVIAWLRQHDYLNEERFVESRVHARSACFGASRIRRELAEHGLQLPAETAADLRATEAERAAEVWQRKFGQSPVDAAGQARQTRFLVARGFAPEVVRRLVRIDRRTQAADSHEDEVGRPLLSDD